MVDNFNCDRAMRKTGLFAHALGVLSVVECEQVTNGPSGRTAGVYCRQGAHASLLADSSSYTYNRYVWKENAKGGRWERLTVKHHALITLNGCIVASTVTDGDCDDSRILKNLT